MTKKDLERFIDLEKRISLLEQHLIETLMGVRNAPPPMPYQTTHTVTCPLCHMQYKDYEIHQCPNYAPGQINISNGSSPNTYTSTSGNTGGTPSAAQVNIKSQVCTNCGWSVEGIAGKRVLCVSCGQFVQL